MSPQAQLFFTNTPRKANGMLRVLGKPSLVTQRDVLRFVECFLCARHCSELFSCTDLFKSPNNPTRLVFLTSPFYRRRKETEAHSAALCSIVCVQGLRLRV